MRRPLQCVAVDTRAVEHDALASSMAAYQAGDAAAFDDLYATLAPVLRRYLGSLARDDVRVDDLVQETFLQIHRARRTYNPERPLVPWSLAIARHVFLMDCRTRRRKRYRDGVELQETTIATTEARHDDAFAARNALDHGLDGLSAGTRRAVLLHHVHGWSFEDIAKRMGINNAAARLRASRGLTVLRKRLGGGGRGGDRV